MVMDKIRIFPSIWENEEEKRFIEINVFREGEAEQLAKYFSDHGIETLLVTTTENIRPI